MTIAGLVMAAATPLAAQGGAQTWRPAPHSADVPAETPANPSTAVTLELATAVLHTLVGRWRFEVRFAGNFTGAPDASGSRVFATLFEDLRVEWTESLAASALGARGMMGFDPETGLFYSTAVYSSGPGVELLTGSMDLAEPVITFTPTDRPRAPDATGRPMASFVLRVIDADHFTWGPLDRSWRAVFTREP